MLKLFYLILKRESDHVNEHHLIAMQLFTNL